MEEMSPLARLSLSMRVFYDHPVNVQTSTDLLNALQTYGSGRRKFTDELFAKDNLLPRFGYFDKADVKSYNNAGLLHRCNVPGCKFVTQSILNYENHYNSLHRYTCSQCKKVLPSSHLLDLHIQEHHDSFFAVMAEKKPAYSCYIEECKEKFINSDERFMHGVKVHKLPRDYRFDYKENQKPKIKRHQSMDTHSSDKEKINFTNCKHKTFNNYTFKKFTGTQPSSASVDIDAIMTDLKENLPE